MPDMIGIAGRLPTISSDGARRLERALNGTEPPHSAPELQSTLLTKRDALLELVEARA